MKKRAIYFFSLLLRIILCCWPSNSTILFQTRSTGTSIDDQILVNLLKSWLTMQLAAKVYSEYSRYDYAIFIQ